MSPINGIGSNDSKCCPGFSSYTTSTLKPQKESSQLTSIFARSQQQPTITTKAKPSLQKLQEKAKKKFLNLSFNTPDLDCRGLYNLHLDHYISGEAHKVMHVDYNIDMDIKELLEGWTIDLALEQFIFYLEAHNDQLKCTKKQILLGRLKEIQYWDQEFQKRYTNTSSSSPSGLKSLLLKKLKENGELWLPGGWIGIWGGHQLLYGIQGSPERGYTWLILNTGKGINFHEEVHLGAKSKINPVFEVNDIPKEILFDTGFLVDLISKAYNSTQRRKKDLEIYEQMVSVSLGTIQNCPKSRIFIDPQQSGTCVAQVLYAFCLYSLGNRESYSQFKHFMAVASLGNNAKALLAKKDSFAVELIENALHLRVQESHRFYKDGYLDENSYLKGLSIFWDIETSCEQAKDLKKKGSIYEFKSPEQRTDLYIQANVNCNNFAGKVANRDKNVVNLLRYLPERKELNKLGDTKTLTEGLENLLKATIPKEYREYILSKFAKDILNALPLLALSGKDTIWTKLSEENIGKIIPLIRKLQELCYKLKYDSALLDAEYCCALIDMLCRLDFEKKFPKKKILDNFCFTPSELLNVASTARSNLIIASETSVGTRFTAYSSYLEQWSGKQCPFSQIHTGFLWIFDEDDIIEDPRYQLLKAVISVLGPQKGFKKKISLQMFCNWMDGSSRMNFPNSLAELFRANLNRYAGYIPSNLKFAEITPLKYKIKETNFNDWKKVFSNRLSKELHDFCKELFPDWKWRNIKLKDKVFENSLRLSSSSHSLQHLELDFKKAWMSNSLRVQLTADFLQKHHTTIMEGNKWRILKVLLLSINPDDGVSFLINEMILTKNDNLRTRKFVESINSMTKILWPKIIQKLRSGEAIEGLIPFMREVYTPLLKKEQKNQIKLYEELKTLTIELIKSSRHSYQSTAFLELNDWVDDLPNLEFKNLALSVRLLMEWSLSGGKAKVPDNLKNQELNTLIDLIVPGTNTSSPAKWEFNSGEYSFSNYKFSVNGLQAYFNGKAQLQLYDPRRENLLKRPEVLHLEKLIGPLNFQETDKGYLSQKEGIRVLCYGSIHRFQFKRKVLIHILHKFCPHLQDKVTKLLSNTSEEWVDVKAGQNGGCLSMSDYYWIIPYQKGEAVIYLANSKKTLYLSIPEGGKFSENSKFELIDLSTNYNLADSKFVPGIFSNEKGTKLEYKNGQQFLGKLAGESNEYNCKKLFPLIWLDKKGCMRRLQIPELGLSFQLKEDSNGKRRFACEEYPGYYLCEHSHPVVLAPKFRHILLSTLDGHKRLILLNKKKVYHFSCNKDGYALSSSVKLNLLVMFQVALINRDYDYALFLLRNCEKDDPYTDEEQNALDTIPELGNEESVLYPWIKISPIDTALRTRLLYLFARSTSLEGYCYKKMSMDIEDYFDYMKCFHRIPPKFRLSREEDNCLSSTFSSSINYKTRNGLYKFHTNRINGNSSAVAFMSNSKIRQSKTIQEVLKGDMASDLEKNLSQLKKLVEGEESNKIKMNILSNTYQPEMENLKPRTCKSYRKSKGTYISETQKLTHFFSSIMKYISQPEPIIRYEIQKSFYYKKYKHSKNVPLLAVMTAITMDESLRLEIRGNNQYQGKIKRFLSMAPKIIKENYEVISLKSDLSSLFTNINSGKKTATRCYEHAILHKTVPADTKADWYELIPYNKFNKIASNMNLKSWGELTNCQIIREFRDHYFSRNILGELSHATHCPLKAYANKLEQSPASRELLNRLIKHWGTHSYKTEIWHWKDPDKRGEFQKKLQNQLIDDEKRLKDETQFIENLVNGFRHDHLSLKSEQVKNSLKGYGESCGKRLYVSAERFLDTLVSMSEFEYQKINQHFRNGIQQHLRLRIRVSLLREAVKGLQGVDTKSTNPLCCEKEVATIALLSKDFYLPKNKSEAHSLLHFEARRELVLRKKQIHMVAAMNLPSLRSVQAASGTGKSDVITPLILQSSKINQKCWVLLTPDSLHETSTALQRRHLADNSIQSLHSLHINRKMFKTAEGVYRIKAFNQTSIDAKPTISRAKDLQSLLLQYFKECQSLAEEDFGQSLLNYMRLEKTIKYLKHNSRLLCDEVHDFFNPWVYLSYDDGLKRKVDSNRWQMGLFLLEKLISSKTNLETLEHTQNLKDYQQKLMPYLINQLITLDSKFGRASRDQKMLRHWLSFYKETPSHDDVVTFKNWKSHFSQSVSDHILLARAYLHVIVPQSLFSKLNAQYGAVHDSAFAKPYRGNNNPSTAHFAQADMQIFLTGLRYLREGMSTNQVKELVCKWKGIVSAEKISGSEATSSNSLNQKQKADKLLGEPILLINESSNDTIKRLHKRLAKNSDAVLSYLSHCLYPKLDESTGSLTATALDVSMVLFNEVKGMAATLNNKALYPPGMKVDFDPATDGELLSLAFDTRVCTIKKYKRRNIESVVNKNNKIMALADPCNTLAGISNEAVAQRLLSARKDLQGVVIFDSLSKKPVIMRRGGNKEDYIELSMRKLRLFVYYDGTHCTGSHFPMQKDIEMAVMIDVGIDWTTYAQTLKRARQLGPKGQKAHILLTPEAEKELTTLGFKRQTALHGVAILAIRNEGLDIERSLFPNLKQMVRACFRRSLVDKLLNTEDLMYKIALMKHCQPLLQKAKDPREHLKLGDIQKVENQAAVIQKMINDYSKTYRVLIKNSDTRKQLQEIYNRAGLYLSKIQERPGAGLQLASEKREEQQQSQNQVMALEALERDYKSPWESEALSLKNLLKANFVKSLQNNQVNSNTFRMGVFFPKLDLDRRLFCSDLWLNTFKRHPQNYWGIHRSDQASNDYKLREDLAYRHLKRIDTLVEVNTSNETVWIVVAQEEAEQIKKDLDKANDQQRNNTSDNVILHWRDGSVLASLKPNPKNHSDLKTISTQIAFFNTDDYISKYLRPELHRWLQSAQLQPRLDFYERLRSLRINNQNKQYFESTPMFRIFQKQLTEKARTAKGLVPIDLSYENF
jgi:Protein of unknown function (DUF3638)